MPRQYGLLSFGVFLIIAALIFFAYSVLIITRLDEAITLLIAFYGIWTIVLGGIRAQRPEKYGGGVYSTFIFGILLTTLGTALFLIIEGYNIVIILGSLLGVIGILAIIAAIPSIRRK